MHQFKYKKLFGFSLVELMVGLVIGLLATLAIMQVFSLFEGQKRTTSGTGDAQTSGSIALYSLQRDVQLAGYGLPLYDANNLSLRCSPPPTFNHDNNSTTPNIDMWPVDIVDGGALPGASDTVIVRYGNSPSGGIPIIVSGPPVGNEVTVPTNMACSDGDAVFAVTGTNCTVTQVSDTDLVAVPSKISLLSASGISGGTRLSCMGAWNEFQYAVVGNVLMRNGQPLVAGIVNIQAQYGISASPASNQITQWVDATGPWATPNNTALAVCNNTSANRNCIKAIRVALVAQNALLERGVVSTACSSLTGPAPTGLCAWDATSANPIVASPAPSISLTNIPGWDSYRYRVYESVVTLRNVVWSRSRL